MYVIFKVIKEQIRYLAIQSPTTTFRGEIKASVNVIFAKINALLR